MRAWIWALLFGCAALFQSRAATATPASIDRTEIHLITMGPGEHVFTRGGHAALMVAQFRAGRPAHNAIYDFGNTDWDDPWLMFRFVKGDLVFFLKHSGDFASMVDDYGSRQARWVARQRLNLSDSQVKQLAQILEEGVAPERRNYVFHHVDAACGSKIVTLLNELLNGSIRAQLDTMPGTNRSWRSHYNWGFSGYKLVSMGSDLLLGRRHDVPLDRYTASFAPYDTGRFLADVKVPDPSGSGAQISLVEPRVVVVEREAPVVSSQSHFTLYFWAGLSILLMWSAQGAHRALPRETEPAGEVLLAAVLLSGLVGLVIAIVMLLSSIPGFYENELILLFPPTDLALVKTAWRLRKQQHPTASWVQRYGQIRLAVAGLVIIGHLSGALHQRPLILVWLGVVLAITIWGLLRGAAVPHAAV